MSALILAAALGSGLMAGLFFVFSMSIMNALGRIPRASGIAAMQSINVVIQNPVFFLVFFGTALLSIVLGIAALVRWGEGGTVALLVGSLLYLVGIIVVTVVFNVPMNNALAAVDPDGTEAARVWSDYVRRWTAWNHVRTVAGIGALASFVIAFARHQ